MASYVFELADALAWGFFRQMCISALAWCVVGMAAGCVCSYPCARRGTNCIIFASDKITLGWIAILVYATRLAVSLRHVLRGACQFYAPVSNPTLDDADRVLSTLKGPQHAATASLARFVNMASTLYGLADAHFERAMGHAVTSILHDIVVQKQAPPPKSGMKILETYVKKTKQDIKDRSQQEELARKSVQTLHDLFED